MTEPRGTRNVVPWLGMSARSAAGLMAVGVTSGFGLVTLGIQAVGTARANDGDIFGFLRQAFGGSPAVVRQAEPTAAAEAGRRLVRRHAVIGRRKHARQLRRRVRRHQIEARREQALRRSQPDLSVSADQAFGQQEHRAHQAILGGRGAEGGSLNGRRTMCVRLCDGYAFPVGTLQGSKDLPLHQTACDVSCPGAATALFTQAPGETDVTQARSLSGQAYGSLRTALIYRRRQVAACSCHTAGQVAQRRLPFGQDRTLRDGDIVVGTRTAYVVDGTSPARYVSLRQDRSLSPPLRRQLERAVGGTEPPVRVRLSSAAADPMTIAPAAPVAGPVRVVLPTPYPKRP